VAVDVADFGVRTRHIKQPRRTFIGLTLRGRGLRRQFETIGATVGFDVQTELPQQGKIDTKGMTKHE
jgi:hypothetical protein